MSLFNTKNWLRPAGMVLSCMTVFAALSSAETYVIAHFPFGGGWSSRLVFANSGTADVTADVTFFTQAGATGAVPLEGQQGTQSSQHLVIGKNQVVTLNADPTQRNAGALQVMWGKVVTSGPLTVLTLFDSSTPTTVPTTEPATLVTGAVGAQSIAAATSFRFPVAISGPLHYNAGVAIANPNSTATNFTIFLMNADGTTNHSITMSLQANGQTSFVLTDSTIFGNNVDPNSPSLFNGSIAICATQPVGVVPIGIEGGALYTIPTTNDACPVVM